MPTFFDISCRHMVVFPKFQLWHYLICWKELTIHFFSVGPGRWVPVCQHCCSALLAAYRSRQWPKGAPPLQWDALSSWLKKCGAHSYHSSEVQNMYWGNQTIVISQSSIFCCCLLVFKEYLSIAGVFAALLEYTLLHNLILNLFPVSFYTLQPTRSGIWAHIIFCLFCLYQVPED